MLISTFVTQWGQDILIENGLFVLYSSQKKGKDHKGTKLCLQKKFTAEQWLLFDSGYFKPILKRLNEIKSQNVQTLIKDIFMKNTVWKYTLLHAIKQRNIKIQFMILKSL